MPSATPHGYPYPVGTDPVKDGENAIQALAEAADTLAGRLASATVNVTSVAATVVNVNVVFPAGRFSAAPVVTLAMQAAAALTNDIRVGVGSITAAGCIIYLYRGTGSGVVPVNWIAHQD